MTTNQIRFDLKEFWFDSIH